MGTEKETNFAALVYKMQDERDTAVKRPRADCILEMKEQTERVENKVDECISSINALGAKIDHVFAWKQQVEKEKEIENEERKIEKAEQKSKDRKIFWWLVGIISTSVGSIFTYVAYSIAEHIKKKVGF